MNSIDHLRYIFSHLDSDLAYDIEENTPGGLKMLCMLYALQLQLEKERYKTSRLTAEYIA
jgi:hypothetical protein|tara:strand:- start:3651 stop:3830 length:180 start_codon:yes stop_codon:yes gene_type:complete